MIPNEERRDLDDTSAFRVRTLTRIEALELAVHENTVLTADIKKNTDDIVDFFRAGQGTFKFLKMIGIAAKWVTSIGAAIALVFVLWKSGK